MSLDYMDLIEYNFNSHLHAGGDAIVFTCLRGQRVISTHTSTREVTLMIWALVIL